MREKIRALLLKHQSSLAVEAQDIAELLHRWTGLDCNGRADLLRKIHTLKGSSGTMGFERVAGAAAEMERAMKSDTPGIPGAVGQDVLDPLLADLRREVDQVRLEDSTLYAKFALGSVARQDV